MHKLLTVVAILLSVSPGAISLRCGRRSRAADAISAMPRRRMVERALAGIAGSLVVPAAANADGSKVGGRAGEKIRRIARILDDLQYDLFEESWEELVSYPLELRSFVPIFTLYTDSAFPATTPIDTQTRFALRYEVGRFFGAVERLKRAVDTRDMSEAEAAFARISLSYDRYLKAGNLYQTYDPLTSTAKLYEGISDKSLVYIPQSKEMPQTRDAVLIMQGPDKGRTGMLIGVEQTDPTLKKKAIVKLDNQATGVREIKVMPFGLIAKRLDEASS